MQYAVSILLSGISVGGQYALIAIGYTMVYGILRLINFAHGDVFMVAGLMGIYLTSSLGGYLPPSTAILVSLLLVLVLGKFTQLSRKFSGEDKTYAATLQLGLETDSWDLDGEVTGRFDWSGVTPEELRAKVLQTRENRRIFPRNTGCTFRRFRVMLIR